MSGSWTAAVAVSTPASVGEGPWWDAERERLLWVDIPAGVVHAHVPATGSTTRTALGEATGFIVGRSAGGYLAGTAAGIVGLDADLEPTGLIAVPPDLDRRRRINDGVCDPAGRVLLGTVDPSGEETGTLWSMSADGEFCALVDGVRMSNGLAFSPDGRRLYYVDSLARTVDRFAYDPDTGAVSDRRCLCRVPESAGLPDGLAVDERGCLWLAIWGAGEIWRLTPDGEPAGVVNVAAARTTSCAFGGPDRDRLYVTTARDGAGDLDARTRDVAPGAVFVADVGARGAQVWTAGGRDRPTMQATGSGE